MALDQYKDFADRYDLFHGRFENHNPLAVTFFKTLFTENNIHSVLDCACGTGKDLHLFHTLGYEVVGSDISESMLAQAMKNLTASDIKVELHKVDYRRLPKFFNRQFLLKHNLLHFILKDLHFFDLVLLQYQQIFLIFFYFLIN